MERMSPTDGWATGGSGATACRTVQWEVEARETSMAAKAPFSKWITRRMIQIRNSAASPLWHSPT